MLLCDSSFLSGFLPYFRFLMVCEEIQDFHSSFFLSCQAHDPCQLHLSFCLQFWFGFRARWEFIEQNSFKLSLLLSPPTPFFTNGTSIWSEVRPAPTVMESSPHPPGAGREFIQWKNGVQLCTHTVFIGMKLMHSGGTTQWLLCPALLFCLVPSQMATWWVNHWLWPFPNPLRSRIKCPAVPSFAGFTMWKQWMPSLLLNIYIILF